MAGQTPPPLSNDAAEVLEKMRSGLILSGNFADYERPFRLRAKGAATWEDVSFAIAAELFQAHRIRSVAIVGTQSEYEPA